jgi:hypothetical protein
MADVCAQRWIICLDLQFKMKNKSLLIFILLFIHAAFWFILKPAPPFSDDKVYALNAETMVEGHYHLLESPKNHRLTVIAPTALFIKLFGESPFIVSLWTLLCSLITIICLFLFLSKFASIEIAFTASFLIACNNLQIIYSAALFPDVIVALFAFLVIERVYISRINNTAKIRIVIEATIFFYIGFLAKEIILIILPFILFLFIADLRKKINIAFWTKFFITLISGGIILNGIYFITTGDMNFIYHCINKNHNEVFALFSNDELIKRFTYQPLIFLFQGVGYSILLLFFLSYFNYNIRIKSHYNEHRERIGINKLTSKMFYEQSPLIKFFVTYFLILLATYWWLPTSFNHLSPILLFGFERMWMMLLIPLAIIAAYFIVSAAEEEGRSKRLMTITVIFVLAALISVYLSSYFRALMFLIIAISSIIAIILKQKTNLNKQIILAVLLIPLFLIALYFTWQNSNWR